MWFPSLRPPSEPTSRIRNGTSESQAAGLSSYLLEMEWRPSWWHSGAKNKKKHNKEKIFKILLLVTRIHSEFKGWFINTLGFTHNGCHFANNIYKIFLYMKMVVYLIKISLKFVPNDMINNKPALVEIMACHCRGERLFTWTNDGRFTHVDITIYIGLGVLTLNVLNFSEGT